MKKFISIELIKKYLNGECSPGEIDIVHEWFNSYEKYPDDLAGLTDDEQAATEFQLFSRIMQDVDIKRNFESGKSSNAPVRKIQSFKRYFVAASILICAGVSAYFILHNKDNKASKIVENHKSQPILPGGNKALLTLANGTVINLDSVHNGIFNNQGNTQIKKVKNGQLVYVVNKNDDALADVNTITTPIGGQYQIVLSDGTRAWLNSKSSIRFPTVFKGAERRVEITGEVYFEVVHNSKKPFRVSVSGQTIEDIGTEFNVNAYNDEPSIKTTLIKGSVKVSLQGEHTGVTLKPGEQSVLSNNGQLKLNSKIDIEKVIAWKNGFFDFKGADIGSIMRQAARWYNIKVFYKGDDNHNLYTGTISKDVNLQELLSMLQFTGLNYKVEGGNITIIY